MTTANEGIQTLMRLGLTTTQANVYFALLELEKTTGKTISKHLNMARQEVYRILSDLTEKGLVLRRMVNPTEFEPIPMEDCLNLLIERKKKEISETEKNAAKLIKNLRSNKLKKVPQDEESELIAVPQKGNFLHKLKETVANSQTNMDLVTRLSRFHFILSVLDEEIRKALKRGVSVRVLIERMQDGTPLPNAAKALEPNPLFRIKYTLTLPQARFLIIDNRKAIIVTSATKDFAESPTLWTNNPILLRIVQKYFETEWISALENSD